MGEIEEQIFLCAGDFSHGKRSLVKIDPSRLLPEDERYSDS
jgi:hypothetical protein